MHLLNKLFILFFQVLVKQEVTRNVGVALRPEEEVLRSQLETIQSQLNSPQIKVISNYHYISNYQYIIIFFNDIIIITLLKLTVNMYKV